MNPIAKARLFNQCITREQYRRPADVVRWLGAVQAQEYEPAKWGLGLRLHGRAVDAEIERAFETGRILRTHVMRPTWHFVAPADIRWMQDLTAARVHRAMSSYNRRLELDPRTLASGLRVIERALRDRQYLTRLELRERLQRATLVMSGQRLAHLMLHAELEQVVCSGPRRGKQFTYALLAERAPSARRLPRDEALAELSRRFFRSHGPATLRDFAWWSGLRAEDTRRGVEMIKPERREIDGRIYWSLEPLAAGPVRPHLAHLLPIYDEYLVAYRDRDAVPHGPAVVKSASTSVTFQHALVIAGQVAGTWRLSRRVSDVSIQLTPLRRLSVREQRAVATATRRYERFAVRERVRSRSSRIGGGGTKLP